MGRDKSRDWRLFVDESGVFDVQTDDVGIAGLLVPGDLAAGAEQSLAISLRKAIPHLRWPFHSAHFNLGVFHALLLARADGPDTSPTEVRRAQALCARLAEDSALVPLVENANRALDLGKNPDWALLARLARFTRKALPALDRHFETYAVQARFALQQALVRLAAAEVSVIAVGEDRAGAAFLGATPAEAGTERYRLLLINLVRRAADLLAQCSPGPHRLHLHVLERDIFDPRLGRTCPLHLRTIGPWIQEACSGLENVIHPIPERVLEYSPGILSWLVCADFVANRCRGPLAGPHSLGEAEEQIRRRAGAAPRVEGGPGLPQISAPGPCQNLIERARPGRTGQERGSHEGGTQEATVRLWASEQAALWAAALGSHR